MRCEGRTDRAAETAAAVLPERAGCDYAAEEEGRAGGRAGGRASGRGKREKSEFIALSLYCWRERGRASLTAAAASSVYDGPL